MSIFSTEDTEVAKKNECRVFSSDIVELVANPC